MGRILIIGAGFSGTVLATQLLRQASGAPLEICLVDRSVPMGRGLAYGTQSPEHTLNIAAGNMSAFPDRPDHFLRYVQARDATVHAGSFVARRLYGDYLAAILAEAIAGAAPMVRFEQVQGDVIGLARGKDGAFVAVLADRRSLVSERVVLAFGHFPPRDPAPDQPAFYAGARFLRDPWDGARLHAIDAGAPVLLLGTGQTAVDTALTLLQKNSKRRIIAVSRHGLLPQPQHAAAQQRQQRQQQQQQQQQRQQPAAPGLAPGGAGASTLRQQMRALRAHCTQLALAGGDWRDALAALRPLTPALWRAWPEQERKRFLRHVQPYWDSHRHRMAPAAAACIEAARAGGQLQVQAGRIVAFEERPEHVEVVLRLRSGAGIVRHQAAYVVNCTGACGDPGAVRAPLVAQLLAQALVRSDRLGLGLDLGAGGAAIDRHGAVSTTLFYLGPWLRARDWEATAVPELRALAFNLSKHLLGLADEEAIASDYTVTNGR